MAGTVRVKAHTRSKPRRKGPKLTGKGLMGKKRAGSRKRKSSF